MIEFLRTHFDTILTVIVTILGFVITYFITKKNLKNEIIKDKITTNTESIRELPYQICQLLDSLYFGFVNGEKKETDIQQEYGAILSKILAYGSRDAVSIAIQLQNFCYKSKKEPAQYNDLLACYVLLITQLKYDLTGEIISPESWFKLRIPDYTNMQAKTVQSINEIVCKLNLNLQFKIKETENI